MNHVVNYVMKKLNFVVYMQQVLSLSSLSSLSLSSLSLSIGTDKPPSLGYIEFLSGLMPRFILAAISLSRVLLAVFLWIICLPLTTTWWCHLFSLLVFEGDHHHHHHHCYCYYYYYYYYYYFYHVWRWCNICSIS